MHIYSDFDGTIATYDVTDLVLKTFAAAEWEDIETEWQNGSIDAATCMRRQIRLIHATDNALDQLLETVPIDPGFPDFVMWCRQRAIPLTIVSDGVDYFIRRILSNHCLGDIPVFANRLVRGRDGLHLEQPWISPACLAKSGMCKCEVAGAATSPRVYIGDGRSDECVATTADILFAKNNLAAFCVRKDIVFSSFNSFHDVRDQLLGVVSASEPASKRAPAQSETV